MMRTVSGRQFFSPGQKIERRSCQAFAYSAHHGIGPLSGHRIESLLASEGSIDGELFSEVSLMCRQNMGVIVNTEDFHAHNNKWLIS